MPSILHLGLVLTRGFNFRIDKLLKAFPEFPPPPTATVALRSDKLPYINPHPFLGTTSFATRSWCCETDLIREMLALLR